MLLLMVPILGPAFHTYFFNATPTLYPKRLRNGFVGLEYQPLMFSIYPSFSVSRYANMQIFIGGRTKPEKLSGGGWKTTKQRRMKIR